MAYVPVNKTPFLSLSHCHSRTSNTRTAYVAIAPELQKHAAEKQFDAQHTQNTPSDAAVPATVDQDKQTQPQPITIFDNDKSLGKEAKEVVQETKAEIAAAKPSAGWFGLGAFASAFGGANTPKVKENEEKKS